MRPRNRAQQDGWRQTHKRWGAQVPYLEQSQGAGAAQSTAGEVNAVPFPGSSPLPGALVPNMSRDKSARWAQRKSKREGPKMEGTKENKPWMELPGLWELPQGSGKSSSSTCELHGWRGHRLLGGRWEGRRSLGHCS